MNASRGFISLGLVLALVLALVFVGGTGWYVSQEINPFDGPSEPEASATPSGPQTEEGASVAITALAGPSTLAVGERGTWRITLENPDNLMVRRIVTWGDEVVPLEDRDITFALNRADKGYATEYLTDTFTHTYADPGVYQVAVEVVYQEPNGTYAGAHKWMSVTVTASSESATVTEASTQTGEFTGHFELIEREDFIGGDETQCSTLVVTQGEPNLTAYFINLIERGNTVQTLTSDGKLRINLPWQGIPSADQAAIQASTPQSPVTIRLQKNVQVGKGVGNCFSFFTYKGIVAAAAN